MDDKQLKAEFREKASKKPELYYAVGVLKEQGYERKVCPSCKRFYWSIGKDTCGDPACSGGYRFLDGTPAKKEMDYIKVWKEFAKHFRKRGYKPIKRYPVVARWRDDTDFVQASIYDFQPYVVKGEIEPPANPLVVPQFCLRFNDIDNVGMTGAHFTGFVMIGQHAFMPPDKYDQPKYFRDIHSWLSKGLGLPNEEITYHEDAWAGGGNFGPCMEFFSRGLELGNQVYMWYEKTATGYEDLKIKVLDMGMGHERNAWFTQAKPTAYESTFPTVCKYMFNKTGIRPDSEMIKKFMPYSAYLNVDEVPDVNKAWQDVAEKIGVGVKDLREQIKPLAALFSIGEHMRSLLVAFSDGALPSNTGGGYNLRVLYRRSYSLLKEHGWDLSFIKLCELHAKYLDPIFPELDDQLDEVSEILDVEEKKYIEMRRRSRGLISKMLQGPITTETLIKAYDSQGINPQLVAEVAKEEKKHIKIPDDFYAKVASLHDKVSETATKRAAPPEIRGLAKMDLAPTQGMYFNDYRHVTGKAKVILTAAQYVILDKTLFYPTSGGQLHDIGTMNSINVIDVFKHNNLIIHKLEKTPGLMPGSTVSIIVDMERRRQLAQHHTATHIIGAAARNVLGRHVNQAGASKTMEKATLDITHYEGLSNDEIKEIEERSNKIVKKNHPVQLSFMPRAKAELQYGMGIYQGGAVPGKLLRIVNIKGVDVQACAGTHVNSTGEVGSVKILRSSKVQDGIIRLEFSAGAAKQEKEVEETALLADTASLLGCEPDQVPARAEELFKKWKVKVKKGREVEPGLSSTERAEGDTKKLLEKTADILKTQAEHVPKTVKRFLTDLKDKL
ncbi:MAG: alanine--tRNA ligase [Nanoarchaeota archaeon]|nr:alanine--tRNA ligase [Nanoarchaeota archaeon]